MNATIFFPHKMLAFGGKKKQKVENNCTELTGRHCRVRLTSVGLIGSEGNITSKDVTRSFKMAVIRAFFYTREITEEQESEYISSTHLTYTRK